MALQHTVKRGDSLWNLAQNYLGSGTRYPRIVSHHNQEAARFGAHSRLKPIKDANLIYVGQTIMVPAKKNDPDPGVGKRPEAIIPAQELGCKLEYEFKGEKNPIRYKPIVTKDYTIETEMTGKIALENLTEDRYRHNFEIAMITDSNQLSSKLDFGDQAIGELTKSIEATFDITTGKVNLKASIATYANIGPYTFEAKVDAPNHLTFTLKPKPIKAVVDKGQRKYEYCAEIAFKVDITVHPKVRDRQPQTRPDPLPQRSPKDVMEEMGPVTIVGAFIAYILWVIYGPKVMPQTSPISPSPFLHPINQRPMA